MKRFVQGPGGDSGKRKKKRPKENPGAFAFWRQRVIGSGRRRYVSCAGSAVTGEEPCSISYTACAFGGYFADCHPYDRRVRAGRVTRRHVSRPSPPNPPCDFHRNGLSRALPSTPTPYGTGCILLSISPLKHTDFTVLAITFLVARRDAPAALCHASMPR